MYVRAALIASVLLSTCAAPSQTLELTVSEAVDRALAENARMAVRMAELAASEAEAKAAGRPDPIRLSLSPATIWEELEAAVSAVLGISGKRKWASRAARHELAATVAGNEEFRLELAASVRSTYWRLRVAQERLAVAEDQVTLADAVHKSANRLAEEGVGKRIDVDRAENELAQARLKRREGRAAIRETQSELALLIVVPPETPIMATDPIPSAPAFLPPGPDLQELAVKSRPAMRRVGALARAALARVGIAGSQRNPELGVSLEREDGVNFGRALLDLPLIDFGTIKYGKRAARAQAEAATSEVDVMEAEIREEAQTALDVLAAASGAEQRLSDELIPRQEGIVARLQRAYEARSISYLDLLEAQTTLRELRAQWIEAVTARIDATVRLERAAGLRLEEIQNGADDA